MCVADVVITPDADVNTSKKLSWSEFKKVGTTKLSPVEEDVDADSLDGSGSGMHAASPARAWYSLPAAHKRDMLQSSCAALGYPVPAEFCEAALRVQRRAVS